jgi:hypothetical protein
VREDRQLAICGILCLHIIYHINTLHVISDIFCLSQIQRISYILAYKIIWKNKTRARQRGTKVKSRGTV